MLLGYIAGILNQHIGAYFEDIDPSQLTGSIFGGGVTLNDLNLRPSIFESLGIPFHVVGGKCGRLEVKYSLTKLYSEPVVVTLKDLHVLIVSARGVEYNADAEKEAIQQEKMRQLNIFESVKHHIIETQQRRVNKTNRIRKPVKNDDSSMLTEIASAVQNTPQEATYFDMWVMQVLRNIKLSIERVHVRFEDDVTKPLEPFAVGVFLQSLEILTTDSNWTSQYIKDYLPETSYKLVNINGLSVYWNPAPTTLYKGITDKSALFKRLSTTPKTHTTAFNKLFEPVSIDLKVQVTPFPDITHHPFSKPKMLIETSLKEFILNGSDKQFKDILPFMETLDLLTKSHKYRKYRASLHGVPVHGHTKQWWKFAYNCILDDIQRKRNNFRWNHILAHRKKCKNYLQAYYKKKAENKSTHKLDQTIAQLERELDLFMLILLREHVDIIILRQDQSQQPQNQGNNEGYISWLTSWFSYYYWFPTENAATDATVATATSVPPAEGQPVQSHVTPASDPNFSVTELRPNDKEMIRVAVGFAKNIDSVNYPDDYVALEANVLLNCLRAKIYRMTGKNRETVLEAQLDKVSFALRCRPVDDGLELELKMGRIEVYGGDYPKGGSASDISLAPPLITTANPNAVEYFIKFMYEKNPLDSEVNQKVSFEGLALQFTYLADSIDRIVECFAVSSKKDTIKTAGHIPASKVLRKVMQFRNSPTSRLLRMMENKGKVELNICLIAPYLVIPQDSTTKGKANFVVVNLGEINIVGTLVGGTLCENGTCSNFL